MSILRKAEKGRGAVRKWLANVVRGFTMTQNAVEKIRL